MKLLRDTKGSSMTEYIIIVAVVAIAAIGAFKTFGEKIFAGVRKSAAKMETTVDDGIEKADETGTE